ncbi:MAG: PqqD family protein [Geobacteraceae bacterium]|nr:PqqD family protein [Geobacteraceae bacterium]
MAIEPTTRVVRTEGIMTAPVDQEIVLLNMAGNNYISLDAIGRRIWELLETSVVVEDLCGRLGDEFEATQEQIRADVLPFLAELEREGLVRVAD